MRLENRRDTQQNAGCVESGVQQLSQITRRRSLEAAASVLLLAQTPPGFAARNHNSHLRHAHDGYGGLALTAEISFPGASPTDKILVYDIADGVDLGAYI